MILSLSGKAHSGKDLVASIIQKLTTPKPHRTIEDDYGNPLRDDNGRYILEAERSPWVIKKWAGVLRKVTSIMLGLDEPYTYTDEFKASVLPEEWDYYTSCESCYDSYVTEYGSCSNCGTPAIRHQMTGRYFLQYLGTNAIRNGLHQNAWVNALMSGYKPTGRCKSRCERSMENMTPGYECVEDKYCYKSNYPLWIISDTRFPNELKAVKDKGGITIRIDRPGLSTVDLHPSETALGNAEFDYIICNNGTIQELEEKVKKILVKEGIIK